MHLGPLFPENKKSFEQIASLSGLQIGDRWVYLIGEHHNQMGKVLEDRDLLQHIIKFAEKNPIKYICENDIIPNKAFYKKLHTAFSTGKCVKLSRMHEILCLYMKIRTKAESAKKATDKKLAQEQLANIDYYSLNARLQYPLFTFKHVDNAMTTELNQFAKFHSKIKTVKDIMDLVTNILFDRGIPQWYQEITPERIPDTIIDIMNIDKATVEAIPKKIPANTFMHPESLLSQLRELKTSNPVLYRALQNYVVDSIEYSLYEQNGGLVGSSRMISDMLFSFGGEDLPSDPKKYVNLLLDILQESGSNDLVARSIGYHLYVGVSAVFTDIQALVVLNRLLSQPSPVPIIIHMGDSHIDRIRMFIKKFYQPKVSWARFQSKETMSFSLSEDEVQGGSRRRRVKKS